MLSFDEITTDAPLGFHQIQVQLNSSLLYFLLNDSCRCNYALKFILCCAIMKFSRNNLVTVEDERCRLVRVFLRRQHGCKQRKAKLCLTDNKALLKAEAAERSTLEVRILESIRLVRDENSDCSHGHLKER